MTTQPDQNLAFEFRFSATLPIVVRQALDLPECIPFSLWLTQAEFEDYQLLKKRVHQAMERRALATFRPCWRENPPVDPVLVARLGAAIGCSSGQLIPYYQHGWHHRHYKQIIVDGIEFRYMAFSQHQFVKVAPHPGPWPTCALSPADRPAAA